MNQLPVDSFSSSQYAETEHSTSDVVETPLEQAMSITVVQSPVSPTVQTEDSKEDGLELSNEFAALSASCDVAPDHDATGLSSTGEHHPPDSNPEMETVVRNEAPAENGQPNQTAKMNGNIDRAPEPPVNGLDHQPEIIGDAASKPPLENARARERRDTEASPQGPLRDAYRNRSSSASHRTKPNRKQFTPAADICDWRSRPTKPDDDRRPRSFSMSQSFYVPAHDDFDSGHSLERVVHPKNRFIGSGRIPRTGTRDVCRQPRNRSAAAADAGHTSKSHRDPDPVQRTPEPPVSNGSEDPRARSSPVSNAGAMPDAKTEQPDPENDTSAPSYVVSIRMEFFVDSKSPHRSEPVDSRAPQSCLYSILSTRPFPGGVRSGRERGNLSRRRSQKQTGHSDDAIAVTG